MSAGDHFVCVQSVVADTNGGVVILCSLYAPQLSLEAGQKNTQTPVWDVL
jgi:hypothetical protein